MLVSDNQRRHDPQAAFTDLHLDRRAASSGSSRYTDRIVERLRADQTVLRFGEAYGNTYVDAACRSELIDDSTY